MGKKLITANKHFFFVLSHYITKFDADIFEDDEKERNPLMNPINDETSREISDDLFDFRTRKIEMRSDLNKLTFSFFSLQNVCASIRITQSKINAEE